MRREPGRAQNERGGMRSAIPSTSYVLSRLNKNYDYAQFRSLLPLRDTTLA